MTQHVRSDDPQAVTPSIVERRDPAPMRTDEHDVRGPPHRRSAGSVGPLPGIHVRSPRPRIPGAFGIERVRATSRGVDRSLRHDREAPQRFERLPEVHFRNHLRQLESQTHARRPDRSARARKPMSARRPASWRHATTRPRSRRSPSPLGMRVEGERHVAVLGLGSEILGLVEERERLGRVSDLECRCAPTPTRTLQDRSPRSRRHGALPPTRSASQHRGADHARIALATETRRAAARRRFEIGRPRPTAAAPPTWACAKHARAVDERHLRRRGARRVPSRARRLPAGVRS